MTEQTTTRENQYCRCDLKANFCHPREELKRRDKTCKQWEPEYNRDIDEYQSGLCNIFRRRQSTLSEHERNEEMLERLKVGPVEETKTLRSKLATICNKNEQQ